MKLLYYYSKLKIGGAERSTVRLMNALANAGHDVTLLLRWDGELEKDLDPRVQCVHLRREVPFLTRFGKIGWLINHGIGLFTLLYRCLFYLPRQHYDGAISGLLGYNPSILLRHVKADCYLQMLRNDVSLTRQYGKTEQYMQQYGSRFTAYIGVSQYVTNSFQNCYPELADRAYTVYNILPEVHKEIPRACPEIMQQDSRLRIVTVCRLEEKSKGLLRMANIAKVLQEEFPDQFCWYIVGDGPDKALLQQKIEEYGLEQAMILCGATKDPFPYYAHADLVAVLSYYEGLCGVINEAKLMERPVIATRFSGIDEQITSGVNGMIVENEESAILSAMRRILQQPESIQKYQINGMPDKLLNNKAKITELARLCAELADSEFTKGRKM